MRSFRKMVGMLLIVLLIGGLCIPQVEADAASTVKIVYKNKTLKYQRKRTSIYINGKKKSIKTVPTFMKEGCYVGPASTIFKSSGLGVTYTDNAHKKLTLKYNDHELVMINGNVRAYLDGKEQVWDTAPIYAKYKSSGKKRWIVPLKDVCLALGLNYRVTDWTVRITTPAPVAAPSSSSKVVLVLDAGHGGSDCGAKGNGNLEKTMTLKIVMGAKKYFDKDSRFKVYYTRTGDTYPTLDERYQLANKVNADVFISVHINSYKSTSTGTETLYSNDRNSVTKKGKLNSKDLATYMQKGTVAVTGLEDRGLVNRPNLRVLKYTKMPACLIEYGFISNRSDCIKMNTGIRNNTYGKALYDTLVKYLRAKGRIS